MMRPVHPIEAESYRRLSAAVDLSHLPPLSRAVAERIIHASGDTDYAGDLVLDEETLGSGWEALRADRPIVVDAEMVAAGVTGAETICRVRDKAAADLAARRGTTRSAEGLRIAAGVAGPGAVYVIGNAPTALEALIDLYPEPALVIGLPVGWVGAVEAKRALRDSGLPALSNRGRKGGSAVAAAALNALLSREVA
ncbi:MAG: precorrin-8X methylmutase [Nitriliruptorales bacterium]|nr:precorrin-8X methylmutase [Nitriliruptorales bacterium]